MVPPAAFCRSSSLRFWIGSAWWANQLGLGDRDTGLHGNRHGIGPLGLEPLLLGKVLADGFEESGEVFLRQGFQVGYG